jgi:hypothetical protein
MPYMPIALDQLPDDVDALKSLVADQLARNEQLTTENQHYKAQVLTLTEQLNLALARRYAASSEKLSPDQICLFDEAETQATAPGEDETVSVPAHSRRKRGRKPLPEALPRVAVIHELPEAERVCPHDGHPLTEVGEVTSEQLDIIPARIRVIRHVRKQYACRCGQFIRTAALPLHIPAHREHSFRFNVNTDSG